MAGEASLRATVGGQGPGPGGTAVAPSDAMAPLGHETSRLVRGIGLTVVMLALISVTASWLILTGLAPIEPTDTVIIVVGALNGLLLAILVATIGYEIFGLVVAWQRGRAAARLHGRIITMFSLLATLPAIIVAVLASVTLDRGLDRWFADRTRQIVDNALTVANAYVQEHARVLRGDLIAMAADIDRAKPVYDFEPARFDAYFSTQSSLRLIPAAFLLNARGEVITRVVLDPNWTDLLMPPAEAFEQASTTDPVMIAPGTSNQVGGVLQLSAYDEMYLYVARPMDPRVLEHLRSTRLAAVEYNAMDQSRFGVQVAFALVYVGIALVLMLAAIWLGIGFANRLVQPIRRLITAADQVSKGNFDVALRVRAKDGDLGHLSETFNTMTEELRTQRAELLDANEVIDERRRFTEAVLSGVSAGVLGLDADAVVTLVNRSALDILGATEDELIGKTAGEAIPELASLVFAMNADPLHRMRQTQASIVRGGRERIVSARLTAEREGADRGFVLTLDDITDLVTAQRSSAWADIARRIAHEIKNPLTPIQLSAERIKRRYGKRVEDDRVVFDQCVDTIIRQVGDIERMVNEFSSFARMPKANKETFDLSDAIREAVFLLSVARPEIEFITEVPNDPLMGAFDRRLVVQAIQNLVKNATEAIDEVPEAERGHPKVTVIGRHEPGRIVVDVIDTGIGLPTQNRRRLLEPYMTTREKGTGLGLAIVRKIAEEHDGTIELLDSPEVAHGGRGAMVRLAFATELAASSAPEAPAGAGWAAGSPEAASPTLVKQEETAHGH